MSLYRLLLRSTSAVSAATSSHSLRYLALFPTASNNNNIYASSPSRSYAFSSAEEAAAERRRRKRRLRIEPPLHALQRNPNPPPRDPNAPRLPDSTHALTGPRLNLHNRVQSLIRASDLDAASHLARNAVYSRTRPTVFTCNAIIAAMYRAKRYNEAVALFKYFFEQHEIVPNVVSYNNLINTHCDEGRVDTGLEVYRHIIATAPFSPSPVTYRHLTKGLIDAGRIEDAVDLLREMLNKGHGADSLVYNNLIKGFLELGNLEKANEFFDELKERCLVYDGVVNATFMEWWFKQGKDKQAMESYKSLMDKKFRMVPATCNVLLEVLVKYGKKEDAWALFEQMLDNHTPPNFQAVNSDTFNIMVNECFREGKFAEAVDTFNKVGSKPGSKRFAMDVAGYNNIIARFCENGMLEEAEKFFIELSSKSLTPDVTCFRTLIDASLKMERIDDALRFFDKMAEAGLRVVASFGTRVFGELVKNGKAIESAEILTKMGNKDPKPDASIYDVVVRGLCDAGAFDKGKVILEQMMQYAVGVPPSLKELVRKAFRDVGRGEEIELVLDENRWRNTLGPSHMQRQPRAQLGPPQMARQQSFGPSPGFRQPPLGQPQTVSQQPFRNHQMSGEAPLGSPQVYAQQNLGSHGMAGQRPFVHHQTSGGMPSASHQVTGQQPFGHSQTTGEIPSGSHQWTGQQPFGHHQKSGEMLSGSHQMTGQQPYGSSQMAGHQSPVSYQMAGQQSSWSSQMNGQQPSWSSQTGGQQPSWSSQTGGQQPSWSYTGGQQPSWSSQAGGHQPSWSSQIGVQQPPGTPHLTEHHPHGSPQTSGNVPRSAADVTSTNGFSTMPGQYQWQLNQQKPEPMVGQQPNGHSEMAGEHSSGAVEWQDSNQRAAV